MDSVMRVKRDYTQYSAGPTDVIDWHDGRHHVSTHTPDEAKFEIDQFTTDGRSVVVVSVSGWRIGKWCNIKLFLDPDKARALLAALTDAFGADDDDHDGERVSDCCGVPDGPTTLDGPSWGDLGLCSNCREHCTYAYSSDKEVI